MLNTIDLKYRAQFYQGYVTCAFWTSSTDDDKPLDQVASEDDLAPEAAEQMEADCTKFINENTALLLSVMGKESATRAGHDFWLTRNHHGAGFWDRDLGEPGDKLTKAAQAFPERSLIVGDNGKIYCE